MDIRIQNSLKPLQRWRRWLVLHYIIYFLCIVLLICAIYVFLFSDCLPAFSLSAFSLPPWLDKIIPVDKIIIQIDKIIQRDAVVAVINTIGVTAIVIAWLINITDQTICKERIGVLINWAYPGFFFFYFTVFLMTVLCGVYLGDACQRRLPIILVAFGIVLGVALIARVSYIFLFSYKKRDRIAFTYHEAQLKHASALSYTRQRIIIQAANIAAEREVNCEDIHADEIYELWNTCVTEERRETDTRASAEQEGLASGMDHDCCRLARRFWEELIPKSGIPCHQESFLNILTSEMILRPNDTENEFEFRDYLFVGFLLMLARQHDKDEGSWESACQLLTDLLLEIQHDEGQCSLSFKKLFWGLALVMAIESAFNHFAEFDMILELSSRLKIKEFLIHANLSDEARFLDKDDTLNDLREWEAVNTPEHKQAEELQSFLADFRRVFLRESGYAEGICVDDQIVSWEDQIMNFLNNAIIMEPYPKGPEDDMAIVCWLLRKELLNGQ